MSALLVSILSLGILSEPRLRLGVESSPMVQTAIVGPAGETINAVVFLARSMQLSLRRGSSHTSERRGMPLINAPEIGPHFRTNSYRGGGKSCHRNPSIRVIRAEIYGCDLPRLNLSAARLNSPARVEFCLPAYRPPA
jgi:hypothetical protein